MWLKGQVQKLQLAEVNLSRQILVTAACGCFHLVVKPNQSLKGDLYKKKITVVMKV